ncbi:MAG: hypothetical protein IPM06_19950 [Rhizobiales bacterium]|nr:hypothetical protein [Hyphomicrobiales bacterium]
MSANNSSPDTKPEVTLPPDLLVHAFDALRDFEKHNEDFSISGVYDYKRAVMLALLAIGSELRNINLTLNRN